MLNSRIVCSTLLIISLFSTSLMAQQKVEDHSIYMEAVLQAAQKNAEATKNLDPEGVMVFTHPAVITGMGGKENFKKMLTDALNSMKSNGFIIEAMEVGKPYSFVWEQDELRCLVPITGIFNIGEAKVKSSSHLLGFSMDKGQTWYFLEADKLKSGQIVQMMPEFSTSIQIPDDVQEMIVE
ncbi:MAG: hypothetical protein ACI959_000126 [Limisphaerales bacterium]|jgi:hypothetical protein